LIPASIIESPWTFKPKNSPSFSIFAGSGILETSFCIASTGVPAAIFPRTGTSVSLELFKSSSSSPPLITLGEKLL